MPLGRERKNHYVATMSTRSKGTIGVLTAGADCRELKAVIRGVSKAVMHNRMKVVGTCAKDGFRGLQNRTMLAHDRCTRKDLYETLR